MMDFPRRMRDWLFNIMRDLADRHDLSPHFLKLEREAEKDLSRKWANAAIWKFCDLDGHPPDRLEEFSLKYLFIFEKFEEI
jgi:secreted protein acidic and rich in cysteine